MTAPNRLEFLLLPSPHGFAFALLSLISLINMRISQNRRSYSIAIKIVAKTFCQKGHQFSSAKRENLRNDVVKEAMKPYWKEKNAHFVDS